MHGDAYGLTVSTVKSLLKSKLIVPVNATGEPKKLPKLPDRSNVSTTSALATGAAKMASAANAAADASLLVHKENNFGPPTFHQTASWEPLLSQALSWEPFYGRVSIYTTKYLGTHFVLIGTVSAMTQVRNPSRPNFLDFIGPLSPNPGVPVTRLCRLCDGCEIRSPSAARSNRRKSRTTLRIRREKVTAPGEALMP